MHTQSCIYVVPAFVSKLQNILSTASHSLLLLLLLLLLSRFSRVRLRVTPDGSPPGSPVPGIL